MAIMMMKMGASSEHMATHCSSSSFLYLGSVAIVSFCGIGSLAALLRRIVGCASLFFTVYLSREHLSVAVSGAIGLCGSSHQLCRLLYASRQEQRALTRASFAGCGWQVRWVYGLLKTKHKHNMPTAQIKSLVLLHHKNWSSQASLL